VTESQNNNWYLPLKIVGQSVTRVDARAKITGEAEFSADRIKLAGLLYGKTLRSSHPHAQITAIDVSKAEALAGVRAVVTYKDAPANPFEEGAASAAAGPVAPVFVLDRTVRPRRRRDRRRGGRFRRDR